MIFLFSLIIIILVHEFGHLIAAKMCGCKVPRFSIGFGKALVEKKIGGTVYQIAPILLGGFCELKDELKYSRSKYAFTNKTYSQKVFISLAGILVNMIVGILSAIAGSYFLNFNLLMFGIYNIVIGISNALPIPALDGSFWIAFLFEKKLGKKKLYSILESLFSKWFYWLMILNIIFIPIMIYQIYKGYIL